MYSLLRNILFLFDPEDVHHFSMTALHRACSYRFINNLFNKKFSCNETSLKRELFGLNFKNPIGLAAGFDKNALYLNELEALGFGFVEIGTVTPLPQQGNEKPRLSRLPKDRALINRMGFNNDGVENIARRLKERKEKKERVKKSDIRYQNSDIILGGNLGKNKATSNDDAWKDYETCFKSLFDCVDYFVVNVSSPNTPGLRELQEKESLKKILSQLQNINYSMPASKPLLLKIAPDLTKEQLDDIIALSFEVNLNGLVATNTTINRDKLKTQNSKLQTIGSGGLSGKPLKKKSTEVVQYLSSQMEGKIPIIASGGIFTGEDAQEKFEAGASLVQVWTGFIYEGPGIVKKICKHLSSN